MPKFKLPLLLAVLVLWALLISCSHYPKNQPLGPAACNDGYTFARLSSSENGNETFVVLTFSGGGTRAAAFAYGVLAKLRDTHLTEKKTLLDEVDVISTVSGGSFTGAYYALFGNKIFAEFKDNFLYRNIEGELLWKTLNPVNWWRLASPYFSRIDLAAEIYDEIIFNRQTYGALAQKAKKPFLLVNATNLYQGARFEFTGRQFCYLGSDIRSLPGRPLRIYRPAVLLSWFRHSFLSGRPRRCRFFRFPVTALADKPGQLSASGR